jgi:phosphate starvation-inducible membrane PsiE
LPLHFIALEPHAGDGHVCKAFAIFCDLCSFLQIVIVDVERESDVMLFASNLGTRTRCLAGSQVEKADLVPD